jgi:hypothetical protein
LHADASLARHCGASPGEAPIALIHNFPKPHARNSGFQKGKIEFFKCLILFNLFFPLDSEQRFSATPFQSENGGFRELSTKLSTGSVDKNEKCFVYRELANLRRFHMRCVLHCMIFCYGSIAVRQYSATNNWARPRRCRTDPGNDRRDAQTDYKNTAVLLSYAQSGHRERF